MGRQANAVCIATGHAMVSAAVHPRDTLRIPLLRDPLIPQHQSWCVCGIAAEVITGSDHGRQVLIYCISQGVIRISRVDVDDGCIARHSCNCLQVPRRFPQGTGQPWIGEVRIWNLL